MPVHWRRPPTDGRPCRSSTPYELRRRGATARRPSRWRAEPHAGDPAVRRGPARRCCPACSSQARSRCWPACVSGVCGTSSMLRRRSSRPARSTRSTAVSSSPTTASSTPSSGHRPSSGCATCTTSRDHRPSGNGSGARAPGRWPSTRTRAGRPPARHPARSCAAGGSTTGSYSVDGPRPNRPTDALQRVFGSPQPVDEVFGQHTVGEMLALRRRLLGAPARVADAATLMLGQEPFDLAWLTFCAAHVAGHQFWDLSQLDAAELDDAARRVLGTALEDVYAAVDLAIGRIVAALPEGADLMVISPVGMDVNTSRADMLPEMLAAVLGPSRAASVDGDPAEASARSSIWWLRAAVPSGVRARVANAAGAAGPRSHPGSNSRASTGSRPRRSHTRPRTRATSGSTLSKRAGRHRHPCRGGPLLDEIAAACAPSATSTAPRGGLDRAGRRPVRIGHARRPVARPHRALDKHPRHARPRVRSDRYGTVMRRGVGAVGPATTPRVTPGCSWCPAGPVRSSPTGLHGWRTSRPPPSHCRARARRDGRPAAPRALSPSRCGQTRRRRDRTASVAIPHAVATWASTTSAPTTAPWAKPARTSPM